MTSPTARPQTRLVAGIGGVEGSRRPPLSAFGSALPFAGIGNTRSTGIFRIIMLFHKDILIWQWVPLMQLSDRIGRRIKLRDLHVLMAVVQAGSMNKAAALMNTTQPAVSKSIAELERTVGVRLLDRNARGVWSQPLVVVPYSMAARLCLMNYTRR